ncbi:MAG: sensor histidine kinase [Bryobacteraceae bacterium]
MTVHDLRTPLMAAMGYCQLILRDSAPLEHKQVESLEQLQYCLSKVDRLVADLGQLSHGRSGRTAPRRRRADIELCLKRSLIPVIPLAADKQILIRYHVEPPPGPLYFQADQIDRVLINILENACKFTPRGGFIEVDAGPVYDPRLSDSSPESGDSFNAIPNAYRVDVRDSGPGVPPRFLRSIFDAAFIVNRSDERSGTGLGLAISRSIIEAHGGRIWAESQGQGLAVSFVLSMQKRRTYQRRVVGKLTALSATGPMPLAS